MRFLPHRILAVVTVLTVAAIACSSFSPSLTATAVPTSTPAVPNPSGEQTSEGTKIVSGSVTYTNAFFTPGIGPVGDGVDHHPRLLVPIMIDIM